MSLIFFSSPSDFLCSNETPFFSLGEDKAFQGRQARQRRQVRRGAVRCCQVLDSSREGPHTRHA